MQNTKTPETGIAISAQEQSELKKAAAYMGIAFIAFLTALGFQALNEGGNQDTTGTQGDRNTLVTPGVATPETPFLVAQPVPEAPVVTQSATVADSTGVQQIFPTAETVATPRQGE
jgi:hypothetical protein